MFVSDVGTTACARHPLPSNSEVTSSFVGLVPTNTPVLTRTDQLPDVSLEQSRSQPRGWLFKARKGNECSKPGSEIVIQAQKRSSKRRNSAGQLLANRLQMR